MIMRLQGYSEAGSLLYFCLKKIEQELWRGAWRIDIGHTSKHRLSEKPPYPPPGWADKAGNAKGRKKKFVPIHSICLENISRLVDHSTADLDKEWARPLVHWPVTHLSSRTLDDCPYFAGWSPRIGTVSPAEARVPDKGTIFLVTVVTCRALNKACFDG